MGNLAIISGNIVVCDPLSFPDTEACINNILPNKYPVFLILASDSQQIISKSCSFQKKVVCAILSFQKKEVVEWQPIVNSYNKLVNLNKNECFEYPVDSGIACFMDFQAAKIIIDSYWDSDIYEDSIASKIVDLLNKNNKEFRHINLILNKENNLNIVAFSSGFGDGIYPVYLGVDIEGEIVSIVTQFIFGEFI